MRRARRIAPRLLLAALPLAALACASAVPFVPDRQLMASIPPQKARAELERLLTTSARGYYASQDPPPFTDVAVTETGFSFTATFSLVDTDSILPTTKTHTVQKSYEFRSLDPRAYVGTLADDIAVKLLGPPLGTQGMPGSIDNPADPRNDCIYFAKREDAETFLEALGSLKPAADDAPPAASTPGAPAATAEMRCPTCRTRYEPGARFCQEDGAKLVPAGS